MGYGDEQLQELEATINAVDCDVVVTGTPMDLARLIDVHHPVRHARYALADHGTPRWPRLSDPSSGSTGSQRFLPEQDSPADSSGRRSDASC